MRIDIKPMLFIIVVGIAGCSQPKPELATDQDGVSLTQAAGGTATAMMEDVRKEFMSGLTKTAGAEKAVEEALTTAVAAAVEQTLTAVLPAPTDTLQPMDSPTATPMGTPTLIPSLTSTIQSTSTQLPYPTATRSQACYIVIDTWCASHKGCSTVGVRNNSGLSSSWHIWSDKVSVDTTFTIPPGHCTLVTRPGKYNFHITYCDGEVADFSWQLNDKWYYKLSPCD